MGPLTLWALWAIWALWTLWDPLGPLALFFSNFPGPGTPLKSTALKLCARARGYFNKSMDGDPIYARKRFVVTLQPSLGSLKTEITKECVFFCHTIQPSLDSLKTELTKECVFFVPIQPSLVVLRQNFPRNSFFGHHTAFPG